MDDVKRLRGEGLDQAFGFPRQDQVALLPRRQSVEEFQLLLERKIEEFVLSLIAIVMRPVPPERKNTLGLQERSKSEPLSRAASVRNLPP